MSTPMCAPGSVSVEVVTAEEGEILDLGPIKIRVIEDGSHTDNRIGAVIITVEPKAPGPPMHWHRMHDETFLILTGTVRFSVSDEHGVTKEIDAKAGDYVIVPPKSIHAFCNVTDEPASFTPAYYVDFLRDTANAVENGTIQVEKRLEIMANYATFPKK